MRNFKNGSRHSTKDDLKEIIVEEPIIILAPLIKTGKQHLVDNGYIKDL